MKYQNSRRSASRSAFQVAPLNASFFVGSILGFLISAFYIQEISVTWGFTFMIVFVLMFIAACISMQRASPDEQLSAKPSNR